MANYKYNRVQYDTFNVTGELSNDGSTITYTNDNEQQATITLTQCFNKFKGNPITLTILTKSEVDLSDQFNNN